VEIIIKVQEKTIMETKVLNVSANYSDVKDPAVAKKMG